MLKKALSFFKFLVVGIIWTIICVIASRYLLVYLWHFDIFYQKQWAVLSDFWNKNGVIMNGYDYLFFLTLLLIFVLWIWGWRYFYKVKYLKLALAPIEYFFNYQIKKYENQDTHVVIKNMAVAEKKTVEDVIAERIKQEKNESVKGAEALRKGIAEKINQKKE